LGVHPKKRLRVEAQCSDASVLAKVQVDLVDLAEAACDLCADIVGMTDEQAQNLFEAIQVEQCSVEVAPAIHVKPSSVEVTPAIHVEQRSVEEAPAAQIAGEFGPTAKCRDSPSIFPGEASK
jgi:hypothetical protein